MQFHSATNLWNIAHFATACLLSLLISACGSGSGSDVGSQSDQKPPTAKADIIGLIANTTSSPKIFSARANNKVTLTGKNSLAPDVPIMTYKWEQVSGEPVTLLAISGEASVFTTPNVATTTELRFQLTVTDANQQTDTDTLTLQVQPIDDVNEFLSNPVAPKTQLKILAALLGGTTSGTNEQPFSIQAITIAHWRNRAGQLDQIEVYTETLNSIFPAQFSPVTDYDVLGEPRNPQLVFTLHTLNIDDINQFFDDTERDRRLENSAINSAYLDVQLQIIGAPSVNFELFALNEQNQIVDGSSVLSGSTTTATNGALLQTWNNEFSTSITSDKLLAELGLENKTSANNYYLLIDPTAQFTRLKDWLAYAGFNDAHGTASTDPSIIHADYFNNYDLGYGRNAWMRKDANGNVFAYVINFPTVEAVMECRQDFSAFAMEYSDNPDTNGVNPKIVKFYAFTPDAITGDYLRTNSINIDGRGEKMVPGICTSCHQSNSSPSQFLSAADADLGAAFIPFDLDGFLFANAANPALIEPTFNAAKFSTAELTKHSKETQEEAFRQLNLLVLTTYAADPVSHNAAIDLIHGWYGDDAIPLLSKPRAQASHQKLLPVEELPNASFNGSYVQPGWSGEETLYRNVFARNCRTCHVQLSDEAVNFDQYDEFINATNLVSHVYQKGLMPLSRVTMDRFWVSFYGGESSANLLRDHLESLNQVIPAAPGAPVPQFTANSSTLFIGTPVVLDASTSQFANSYSWSINAPNGSNTLLSNTSGLRSSFTPDVSTGTYDITLTVTNAKNEQAVLTQSFSINDLAPLAECFAANTSGLTTSGALAAIPVVNNISILGDGGVTIESIIQGSLGTVTIDSNQQTISYQLNDPFVRGVDTISYRLQDADGSLSTTSSNCISTPTAGYATITIDTTTAGTFAPGAVTATLDPNNNANQVILTWTAPTAVTVDGYNVYRDGSNTPLNGNTLITTTNLLDTGLSENTTYTYAVASVINGFESNPALAGTTTLSLTPTNVAATSMSNSIVDITWTEPTGLVDSYAIYRDSDPTPIITISAPSFGFSDDSLSGGNQYTYAVTGIIGSTESPQSTSVVGTTYPDSPSGLTGGAVSDTQIDMSWGAVNCNNGASYLLIPSVGPAIPTVLTSASVSGLTPNTGYTFTVIAQCNGLTSIASAPSGTIITQDITPSSLTATSISTNQVDLSWAATGTIDSFAIYRDGNSTPIATIPSTASSYSDSSLSSGSQYTYTVTAIAGSYESPTSNSTTGITYPDIPAAPVVSVISDTEIDVSWSAVSCSTVPNYTLTPSADRSPITTNATGGTVGGLQPNTSYTFTVNAECNGVVSADSLSSSVATTFALFPTNLIATAVSTNEIDLSWNAAFGTVDSYLIYRDGSLYTTVDGVTTTFQDQEISGGTFASYFVTALVSNTESSPSNIASATTIPDEPSSVFGALLDSTSITASWIAPFCDGALDYLLTNVDVGTISTSNTSITLNGLTPSAFHNFSVSAVCNGMESTQATGCAGSCP